VDAPAMCRILEEALDKLGVTIRQERMPEEARIAGGLCMVYGQLTVIISPFASATERVEVLANALRGLNTESIWLPPAVRDLLKKETE
jgi:hypothetical protein